MKFPLIEPLEARIAPAGVFSIAKQGDVVEGNSGETDLVYVVTLTGSITSDATVHVRTEDVTATAGSDYTAIPDQLLTFHPGDTQTRVTVKVKGDPDFELDEIVRLRLFSPMGATLGVSPGLQFSNATIKNDDAAVVPTVSVDDVVVIEGDGAATSAVFHLSLSNVYTSIVTVKLNVVGETATAGADFTATATTVTFEISETTKEFTVPIVGDLTREGLETFRVILSEPTNAVLGKSQGNGTISDNDPVPTISFDPASVTLAKAEGNSGVQNAVFTVKLSNPSSEAITVTVASSAGTATNGTDFNAGSQTLTFAPNETSKTFSVPIVGDTTEESDETFFVDLSNPSATATLGTATHAVGTIVDDEIQVSAANVAKLETNGDTTLTFNVSLSQALSREFSVKYATQDGIALSTGSAKDFDALSGTLTFAPGQTSLPVTITVHGDTVGEIDEDFTLKLSSLSDALLFTATGTILNDDAALNVSNAQVMEGGTGSLAQAVFTVTLTSGPATGDVTVKVGTANGSATAGTDYTALVASANVLTFHPGETTKEVRVSVTGDTTRELNETFSLNLTEASSGVAVINGTGTGTILDDDGAAFTINDVTVTEGDSGTSNAVFLVRLLNAASTSVTVDVTAQAGTASTADFTFLPVTRTLTFAAGTLQQLVTVPIVGDLIAEGTERFSLVLSNATGGATILKSTGAGTILDNNDPLPTVSIANTTLVEGNAGTSSIQFMVTLSQPSTGTVTALYSTRDLSAAAHPATAGVDYTAVTDGTVTFAPGDRTATITVPILGDTVDEFDETFGVTLSAPSGANLGTAEAVGTIQNDEVTVSVGDVSIVEGSGGINTFFFRVSLNTPGGGALQNAVAVNYATVDGTAVSTGANKDFTARNGTLTFVPGGQLFQDVEIAVVPDTRLENDEQLSLQLSVSVNAAIGTAKGTATLANDDTVQISIADKTFTEGDPSGSTFFVVSLDQASDLPVTVKVNTANGTALASVTAGTPPVTTANDFTAIVDQTITFAPGETTKNVAVVVQNDAVDELRAETFTVQLSAPSTGATLADGTATATILDDDSVTLSVTDATVIEGDAGTKTIDFTVSLSGVSKQVVDFSYATSDSTATAGSDYVAASGTGTIPIGQTSAHVLVTVNGDTTAEVNERFLLTLQSSLTAKISTTAGVARGTIVDDEAGGARVRLVPANGVDFNEADRVVEFDVVRSGDLSRAVTVQYETVDDTAQSFGEALDFVGKAGTISFAAGSRVASEKIRVRLLGDSNYENDEMFQVRLFNPVNAAVIVDELGTVSTESNTDIMILDDGDAVPTLSVADLRVIEGNSGTKTMDFIVKLSASNEKQTVTVQVEDLAGLIPANSVVKGNLLQDYVSPGKKTLTFDPGDIEKKYTITVNGDVRDEADEETFRVVLSGATNAVISRAEATGTIVDDDAAPTLQFSTTTVSVTEGDAVQTAATFTVNLSEISERPVSVQATTQAGTAISNGARADFVGLDHLVAAYEPGSGRTLTFTVLVNGDAANEVNETFGVTLSDAQFGRLLGTAATGTIVDNDPLPVIAVSDASVVEGDAGTREMIFTVSLSEASGQAVTVNFATQDGTATAVGGLADYIAKTGSLKFAPGEVQKEVRVLVNGDTYRESEETLTLQISAPVNGTILSAFGTGRILQDADTKLGIAIQPAFAVEGNSGAPTISFTVELSDALTTPTTFKGTFTSGTALRGSDFKLPSETENSFRLDANTKTATLPVELVVDTIFEPTETLFVGLRNVLNEGGETVTIVGGAARGTIFNDDLLRVDSQTIQYIDFDGDLATVHISQGVLASNRLSFGSVNGLTGGRQLQVINLTGDNAQFQNADLTVTARPQPGFSVSSTGVKSDGLVNVGAIFAAIAQPNILQFVNGIDLNNVTIGGDLGKIHVGDTGVTSALKNLVVRSMGRLGTTTQGTDQGLDTFSLVLGPIDNFHVRGNFQGTIQVVGSQFGIIRNLQIDGALLGGTAANSGEIFVTGRIGRAVIGRIVGGEGANSGLLIGSTATDSQILDLTVVNDIRGGSGTSSGFVSALSLGTVRVGALVGGAGENSGSIGGIVSSTQFVSAQSIGALVVKRSVTGGGGINSGQISATNVLGQVRVLGEIRGGSGEGSGGISSDGGRAASISVHGAIFGGEGAGSGGIDVLDAINFVQTGALVGGEGVNSGRIHAGGNVNSLSVFGNVIGGSGAGSGGVEVGGRLLSGLVSGGLAGGSSTATTSLVKSGYVFAHRINDLTVRGSVEAGSSGGAFLGSSGEIRSETTIGVLKIGGSLAGSEAAPARIVATGDASAAAIQTLIVGGSTRFAEVLAGYSGIESAANPRGTASNGDAQIGTISIAGNVQATSVVAGVAAGTDGVFGTTDDFPIGGTSATNSVRAVSKIARIIIGGSALAGTSSAGLEAQYLQSIFVGGRAFSLRAGPGNDGAPGAELAAGSLLRVFEVPVV